MASLEALKVVDPRGESVWFAGASPTCRTSWSNAPSLSTGPPHGFGCPGPQAWTVASPNMVKPGHPPIVHGSADTLVTVKSVANRDGAPTTWRPSAATISTLLDPQGRAGVGVVASWVGVTLGAGEAADSVGDGATSVCEVVRGGFGLRG